MAESRERLSVQQYITELESQLADTTSQHNEEVCPSLYSGVQWFPEIWQIYAMVYITPFILWV